MTDTLETRIARGVAFLESAIGADWRDSIKLKDLDLRDPQHCVIGQTFCHKLQREADGTSQPDPWTAGSFAVHDFESEHNLVGDSTLLSYVAEYGFEAGYDSEAYIGYFELQEAWERVIAEK